jgi:hypothetical protein
MKQTAVEWLVEQYKKVGGISISMAEIAKEMEKEQITDAYIMGSYDMAEKQFKPEQYYNEIFKSE